jgi:hypothetical protein
MAIICIAIKKTVKAGIFVTLRFYNKKCSLQVLFDRAGIPCAVIQALKTVRTFC